MLCQNCGENEGNVKYTQIINGDKEEMVLCEKCAKEMGLNNINFDMPISFSSFLGDFFDEYSDSTLLPSFMKQNTIKCENCGLTYDDFIKNGKFGCEKCYTTFEERIRQLVKNLHGSVKHIGRKPKYIESNTTKIKDKEKSKDPQKEESKLEKLDKELKLAIKEERYEDAAKIRDEIKNLENK